MIETLPRNSKPRGSHCGDEARASRCLCACGLAFARVVCRWGFHCFVDTDGEGKGIVKVSDKPAVSCTATCKRTIRVPVGKRVAVTPTPGKLWKLAPFTGACQGAAGKCSFTATRSQTLTVTFLAPGVRANPIPLNTAWKLPRKMDAEDRQLYPKRAAEAPRRHPKDPVSRGGVLHDHIEETYTGSGSSNTMNFGPGFEAIGRHNVVYRYENRSNACGPGSGPLPEPDTLQPYNRVDHRIDSGQTIAGNICFEIATNDASSLLLYVRTYYRSAVVWFALH